MNKILLSLSTVLVLSNMSASAQEENPEPDMTLGFEITNPVPGSFGTTVPKEFTLDFSASSINVTNVVDNSSWSMVTSATSNSDAAYSGTYAYLSMADPSSDALVLLTSAPLSATVNADKTVTLKLDTNDTPRFAAALQSEEIYTLTLNVPANLFTVTGTNINNKSLTYKSLPRSFEYLHLGETQILKVTITPGNETMVESLSTIDLDFGIPVTDLTRFWEVSTDETLEPSVYFREKGTTEWIERGYAAASFVDNDPAKGQLRIIPGASKQGQYRIDVPIGLFKMTTRQTPEGDIFESFTNEAISLHYSIGEEVLNGLPKDQAIFSITPAEGEINLDQIPSGCEYFQIVLKGTPEIDRTVSENIKLFYNGGTTPIKETNPRNETWLRLQDHGVVNDYEHMINLWLDGGESNIDQPGDYVLEIPEGLFRVNGEPVAKLTFNFHISTVLNYQVTPKEATHVDRFDGVTIHYNNASAVVINDAVTEKITLTNPLGYSANPTGVEVNGKTVRINFEPIEFSGYFTLKIPHAYFLVTIGEETLPNMPYENVWSTNDGANPTIDPAPGILDGNEVFAINLELGEDDEIISVLGKENTMTRLLRIDENGDIIYKPEVGSFYVEYPDNFVGGNYVTLIPKGCKSDVYTPIKLEPGNYVLITAQYLYTIKGGVSAQEYFYYYTVLPDGNVLSKPQIFPYENVQSSHHFTLTFAEGTQIKTVANNVRCHLYPLQGTEEEREAVAEFNVYNGDKHNQLDLVNTGRDFTLDTGIYELMTPKGLCWSNNAMADAYALTIYYNMVSGVEVLGTSEDAYNVYRLDGVQVLRNAEASALGTLAPGIYVVNGKKIVIK